MSSIPGYTLEDYVMWLLDIKVKGRDDANLSLQIAEILGFNENPRPLISEVDFQKIISYFEPYRNTTERRLADFDHEWQSWRTYAAYSFEHIPDDVVDSAYEIIEK